MKTTTTSGNASKGTTWRTPQDKAAGALSELRGQAMSLEAVDPHGVDELLGMLALVERGLLELRRKQAGLPPVRSVVVPDYGAPALPAEDLPCASELSELISKGWFKSERIGQ